MRAGPVCEPPMFSGRYWAQTTDPADLGLPVQAVHEALHDVLVGRRAIGEHAALAQKAAERLRAHHETPAGPRRGRAPRRSARPRACRRPAKWAVDPQRPRERHQLLEQPQPLRPRQTHRRIFGARSKPQPGTRRCRPRQAARPTARQALQEPSGLDRRQLLAKHHPRDRRLHIRESLQPPLRQRHPFSTAVPAPVVTATSS